MIDVVDNGVGIEPECRGLIFAPSYTTKQDGRGLGLHSVANYLEASGGRIEAFSDGAGKGTTMRAMLAQASPASEAGDAGPRPAQQGAPLGGRAARLTTSARDGGVRFEGVLGEPSAGAGAHAEGHARISIGA